MKDFPISGQLSKDGSHAFLRGEWRQLNIEDYPDLDKVVDEWSKENIEDWKVPDIRGEFWTHNTKFCDDE